MTDVSICCAAVDKEVADSVAERLSRTAEILVRVEISETPASEAWDEDSAGVLLLLSPDSMPPGQGREPWTQLIEHSGAPQVAIVEVRPCRYPELLKRKAFFRWSDSDALRQIQRWAVSLHIEKQTRFRPPALPEVSGDTASLWSSLVDQAGTAAVDDVRLAQAFANRAAPWFRDIVWIGCLGRTLPFVAGDIAASLEVALDGPAEDAFERAMALARRHRILLVLDGLDAVPPEPDSLASVLCISPRDVPLITSDEPLLRAMSVCLPGGFPIEVAAEIAGAPATNVERWADCLDRAGQRYRLRVATSPDREFRRRHAQVLKDSFSRWIRNPDAADRLAAEVEPAVRWALRNDWELGTALAQAASGFFRDRQRHLETGILVSLPGVQFMRAASTTAGVQMGLF